MKKVLPVMTFLLLVLILAACGETTATTIASTSPQKVTTAATPANKTTSNKQTLPTPTITTVSTNTNATLGQPVSNFEAKYGQPLSNSDPTKGSYNFEQMALNVITAKTDTPRAYAIVYSNTGQSGWSSMEQSVTACRVFLPSDAKYTRTTTGSNGDTQRVYLSPTVAKLFPASSFTDEKGDTTTPGTIAIVYTPDATNANGVMQCSIQVGMEGN